MKLFRYGWKSAVTGKFVSPEYAEAHPATTYLAKMWFWQRERRGG